MTHNYNTFILGGGPAGLSVGYYAQKAGLLTLILEAADVTGGLCRTLRHGDFLLDTGAHRLHDSDPEITAEVKNLLDSDLFKINLASQIYHNGKLVHFPLAPYNLLKHLGPLTFFKSCREVLQQRLLPTFPPNDFHDLAVRSYGKTISGLFLLNYSEKLWGLTCDRLSPKIAGKRLKGLDLSTFIKESILGFNQKTTHMEGNFFYPKKGIGMITDAIAKSIGEQNIRLSSEVTRICHKFDKITHVEINHSVTVDGSNFINTLPISIFIDLLNPQAPSDIREIARSLRFRNIILVTFFIKSNAITDAATVYFPDKKFPFTRIYEPINRSPAMAPKGMTSLVAEIPCQFEDTLWQCEDECLIKLVKDQLKMIGWVSDEILIDAVVYRLPYAYPVLENNYEGKLEQINHYLNNFTNLHHSGRNGLFVYSWLHDMMRFGKEIVDQICQSHA